jgi:hypothetical protein
MKKKKSKKNKIKIRKFWNINPRTKVEENGKRYRRGKKKKELKDILKEFL